jgi:hypothetical protein
MGEQDWQNVGAHWQGKDGGFRAGAGIAAS